MTGNGYRTTYDYVELTVERREDQWCLILKDSMHGETVEHEDRFETPAEARDAALPFAQHHIFIQHNDTVPMRTTLSWSEY